MNHSQETIQLFGEQLRLSTFVRDRLIQGLLDLLREPTAHRIDFVAAFIINNLPLVVADSQLVTIRLRKLYELEHGATKQHAGAALDCIISRLADV